MVSHSVTQNGSASQNWSVLMSNPDNLGTIFHAQQSCYDLAAMNEKEGWVLVADGLTEAEARDIRRQLYAGELTIEDFAAADVIPDDVPQSSQPRRARDIPNFNWYVLSDFDFALYYLVFMPTDAGTPRWVSCVEVIGYEADIEFWQEDIDFLNDLLGLHIGHGDTLFVTPIEIAARSASPQKEMLKGVGHIWLPTHAVGRADWLAGNTAPIIVATLPDNGQNEAPETALSDDYPAEFDWFPPVAEAGIGKRPRFISANGQAGD